VLKNTLSSRSTACGRSWASEVCPGWLYLGCASDAQNLSRLREYRISHVLNVADDVPNFFEGTKEFQYLQLGVKDFGADKGISRVFHSAFEFVEDVRKKKGKVLVHCAAGMNRSVTVAVAVKMLLDNSPLKESFEEVKRRRPQAAPFQDNRLELVKFEKKIRGCNSLSLEEFGQLIRTRAATVPPSSPASLSASQQLPRLKTSTFSFPLLCGIGPIFNTAPAAMETKPPSECGAEKASFYVTHSSSYSDFATLSCADEPSTPTSDAGEF